MTVLRVDAEAPDPDDVALAAAALGAGQLVVLPTDSVYGIGADPTLRHAVQALFRAKGRPRSLSIPVLVANPKHADRLVQIDERALSLMGRFWPGPLTLVLPRKPGVEWDLGDRPGTLAVRMPGHGVALDLLTQAGPLAVSSANRTGEPTPATCDEIVDVFGDAVSVYLDAGPSPGGTASTVVDLTDVVPTVLRQGAIAADAVLGAT